MPKNVTFSDVIPNNFDDTSTCTSSTGLSPEQFLNQAREPSPSEKLGMWQS